MVEHRGYKTDDEQGGDGFSSSFATLLQMCGFVSKLYWKSAARKRGGRQHQVTCGLVNLSPIGVVDERTTRKEENFAQTFASRINSIDGKMYP